MNKGSTYASWKFRSAAFLRSAGTEHSSASLGTSKKSSKIVPQLSRFISTGEDALAEPSETIYGNLFPQLFLGTVEVYARVWD